MSSRKPKKKSKKNKKSTENVQTTKEEEISIPNLNQNENDIKEINDYNNDDNNKEDVIKAFEYFDVNHTGKMDIEELTKILSSFGDIMTEDEMFKIFREAGINTNKEEKIDYIKFINYWIGNK